jgi:hypothetical protein
VFSQKPVVVDGLLKPEVLGTAKNLNPLDLGPEYKKLSKAVLKLYYWTNMPIVYIDPIPKKTLDLFGIEKILTWKKGIYPFGSWESYKIVPSVNWRYGLVLLALTISFFLLMQFGFKKRNDLFPTINKKLHEGGAILFNVIFTSLGIFLLASANYCYELGSKENVLILVIITGVLIFLPFLIEIIIEPKKENKN